MKPGRTFRWLVLGLVGLYFLIPMAASVQFSLEAGYDRSPLVVRLLAGATKSRASSARQPAHLGLEAALGVMAMNLGLLPPHRDFREPAFSASATR